MNTGDSGGNTGSEPGSPYVAPTTILPGRSAQIDLAFELTTEEDAATAVLGNGVGSTRFKEQSLLDDTGTTTDPITRDEQQVNGIWFPRVLTETGFLGALAFALLIAYMCILSWRNRAAIAARTGDGALILALPGIAGLTLLGAFFNTVLAIQPYASIFWPLLGLAIAIDYERRTAAP